MLPYGRYDRKGRAVIHVSPQGADFGDGTLGYPVQTIERALFLIRETREIGEPAIIWLHEGVHHIEAEIVLTAEDSNLTLAAWPEDAGSVIVSGATQVNQWEIDQLDDGQVVWTAPLPAGGGMSMYVSEKRVPRPRFPRVGFLSIAGQEGIDPTADMLPQLFSGTDSFFVNPDDLPKIENLDECHIVVPHFWLQERMPIASVNRDTGEVRAKYSSMLALMDGASPIFARYFLDGVSSELGQKPGEWLGDQKGVIKTQKMPEGYQKPRIFYAPTKEDKLDEFIAQIPTTQSFLHVKGTKSAPVRNIAVIGVDVQYFDNDNFAPSYAPFQMREDPALNPVVPFASDPQGASKAPGTIVLSFTQAFSIANCKMSGVGGYAVRLEEGCQSGQISNCKFADLGAGAIACGGAPAANDPGRTFDIDIIDNQIKDGGHVYGHCAALLIRHASGIDVSYNEICDFPQTAISLGWQWDYGFSPSCDNRVHHNHIHHLGRNEADWFGAIYTLGVSPGTSIDHNLVHHVAAANFGGWGILLDPASSHITVDCNVITHTSHESIHIKTGRENIIRSNFFGECGTGNVSLAVPEEHVCATFINNTFCPGQHPAFVGAPGSVSVAAISGSIVSNANHLATDENGAKGCWAGDMEGDAVVDQTGVWQSFGNDVLSETQISLVPAVNIDFEQGKAVFRNVGEIVSKKRTAGFSVGPRETHTQNSGLDMLIEISKEGSTR